MNNGIDEYKNAFSNNIDNNAIAPKRDLASFIKRLPERDTFVFSKQNNNLIPGYTKHNEAVRFGRKAFVQGTSMVKGIRRNQFDSCLKKRNTRFRPFIGTTIKQMETYLKLII